MRNLFLALLLANLLFLGWRFWVVPPEVPATRLLAAGTEPTLEALVRAGGRTAGGSATSLQPDRGKTAGGNCMRIGPIAEGPVAERLRARLVRDGFRVTLASEDGQIWVGHWVQLDSVATREQADRIVARLAAGGLPDAYILQTEAPFAISLGVFRDRARADNVAAAASRLGFRPTTTDRFRIGTQYWLTAVLAPGRSLPLNVLGQESGQILRAEPVNCPAAPIGGTGPD